MLKDLIDTRCRNWDLAPPYFVQRLGHENITRTYDYLKGFDEDLEMHPMPEPTSRALAQALEVPLLQVKEAASASYRRLSTGWLPGMTPHANIILHPREGPPVRGFLAMLTVVNTRISFHRGQPPENLRKSGRGDVEAQGSKGAQVPQPRH